MDLSAAHVPHARTRLSPLQPHVQPGDQPMQELLGLPGQSLAPGHLSPSQEPAQPHKNGGAEELLSPATDSPLLQRRAALGALPAIDNYRRSRPTSANPDTGTALPTPRHQAGPSVPHTPTALAARAHHAHDAHASTPCTMVSHNQANSPPHSQVSLAHNPPDIQPAAMYQGPGWGLAGGAATQGEGGLVSPFDTQTAGPVSRLRIHVITYNMAGTLPAALPQALFGNEGPPADLLMVGTQESCALGDWERLLSRSLGQQYVKKAQESLLSISLLVYAHATVASRISDVRTSSIACGVGNVLGNKGAVGVSCTVDGARLLLITSHLAAHDEFIERRNADYQRIYNGLFSASATTGNVPVPATPGDRSGATTPLRSESPLRGSPSSSAASEFSPRGPNSGPPTPQSSSLSAPAGNPRVSRFAHVSSMSQLPQPSPASSPARLGSIGSLDPTGGIGNGVATDLFSSSPLLPTISRGSTPRENSNFGPSFDATSLAASPLSVGPRQSALPLHDVVLWSGDLNYRINGTSSAIRHLLGSDMIEVLHANDQLRLQMRKGKVFQGFHEQAIHFPPTFKFRPGTAAYSEKRIPSWTDRILHTAYAHEHMCALEPLYYRDVGCLMDSDHRPVVAGYELTVNPSLTPAPASNTSSTGCVIT